MTTQNYLTILLIFTASCKDTNKKEPPIVGNANFLDTNKILQKRGSNKIDTAIYKPLKFGFYQTLSGDIFEFKPYNDEDSLGWYETFDLDSTLVDGGYSNRKPLKDYLDINTFTENTVSNFSKDKNFVYYVRAQSGGHIRFIVDKADPILLKA